MVDYAIEAVGLAKSFGALQVLGGVSLAVGHGTVFALLGPNGSGKTTTVRILATLLRPDAGSAQVAGFDVGAERHEVRRRISLTGQSVALDGLQTGKENLRMVGRLAGLSAKCARLRAEDLLDRFSLADAGGRRVATYSGGMRRRLDLAASLVRIPEVLFLDEPTTGLDLSSRQAMWQLVADLAAAGVTVFLTTQYLDEADRLANRIAVIDGGRVVAVGTPAELKAQVGGQRLDLRANDGQAFEELSRALGKRVLEADRAALLIGAATDGGAANVRTLLDEVDPDRSRVRTFTVQGATLDDAFLALTGKARVRPSDIIDG